MLGLSQLYAQAPPPYPAAPAAPGNVMKAEYFIDTDPGFGNGINIPLTAAVNLPALAATINTGALSAGIHRLYVRTRSTEGRWSVTSSRLFSVEPNYPAAPAAATNVNKAEYFIDTDPGFGLGTNISLTAALDLPALVASINTTFLSAGIHRLYVRTRNASGRWGVTSSRLFAVAPGYPASPAAPGNVTKAEYFIDTDPGFGLGTNIPLTAATNIPALIASINTASLPAGVHRLYVRTRSAAGRWSETSSLLFATFPGYPAAPAAPGNITRIEYFFDVDPGFGNGVSVPITPGVQISNLSFPVNTSALTAGTHRLFVRSKDDWGLTSVKVLQVNNWVLPLDLLRFDGRKAGQQVDLEWETTNEENTAYFDIERSRNGVEFEPIGQVEAVNKPGQHQYPFSDLNPFNGLNYYRLKQFDLDGKSTYSKVISVLFSNYGESALIYPNPATNRLYIETNYDGTREITLQVYDMSGRQVMHKSIPDSKSKITLDIQSLAPGHYTLQCSDGREVISGRFTKQQSLTCQKTGDHSPVSLCSISITVWRNASYIHCILLRRKTLSFGVTAFASQPRSVCRYSTESL